MDRHWNISASRRPTCLRFQRIRSGFSMSELIIAISILGILSGVVIAGINGAFGASKETLAISRVEMLNAALHTWSTVNREMSFIRRDESTADELIVLRDLQYRNPNQNLASIGSPYIPPDYNPGNSSSDEEYRIRWNGRFFELLRPGQSGSGLLMVFDGSDITEPFQFPPNYQSSGR